MNHDPTKLIVFVCTGNICRSPIAEYLMRYRLGDRTQWCVASAGVFASDGAPASQGAVQALADLNIDASQHRSQMLTNELVEGATLLVVMTDNHKRQVLSYFPNAENKVFRLTEFGASNHAERRCRSNWPVFKSLPEYVSAD